MAEALSRQRLLGGGGEIAEEGASSLVSVG